MSEPTDSNGAAIPRLPDKDAFAGGIFALGAFGIWGFLPVYFKYMADVPALEVLAHRIVWSVIFVGLLLIAAGRWGEVRAALRNRKLVAKLFLTALLISGNWLLFIWAVTHEHMLQGSLGYYINPLINVVMGVVLLGERLSKAKWIAVALTALAVLNLTLGVGEAPWIALTLAMLFGLYGFIRKTTVIAAQPGLFIETIVLMIPAVGYLVYLAWVGEGALGARSLGFDAMLMLAGVLTAVPLIFFAAAARRLRLATLGFFQFLTPTMQFLLAVFVYGEVFTDSHKITFGLIWLALAVYSADSWHRRGKAS